MGGKLVKVIANYLPQFHVIPENSKWWGEGYTDWVAVRNSLPLYEGHDQPRVPYGGQYYSLDEPAAIAWQANLAREAGVYGFGIYHYWFSKDQHLLEKPAELLIDHPEIDINFLFIWDNASWKRTWSQVKAGNDWAPLYEGDERLEHMGDGVLARLEYGGEEEWRAHFEYLLPFFRDKRYIRIEGKPAFCFFATNNQFETIRKMAHYWDVLAKQNGFDGIVCMSRRDSITALRRQSLEMNFAYENLPPRDFLSMCKRKIGMGINHSEGLRLFDYDQEWKRILRNAKFSGAKTLHCGLVDYDDSPRRGSHGAAFINSSPDKFERYFKELLKISIQQGKEFVFLSAWNEWGEGMYLEPDATKGYAYLRALKKAIDSVGGDRA